MGKLAYWIHLHKPTGIATEKEVYYQLGEEWARLKGLVWDEDNPDIEQEIKKFLCQVREHTGLFVERSPRRYGFMHLIFEEYYAAGYMWWGMWRKVLCLLISSSQAASWAKLLRTARAST